MPDDLPEPQSLRVENKVFYFDIGHNRRGTFMRISEVRLRQFVLLFLFSLGDRDFGVNTEAG